MPLDPTPLSGRAAIVTGGSTGLGRAIAAELISRGADVLIASLDQDVTRAAAEALGARCCVTDISDPAAVGAMIDTAIDHFGRLDILVNNAAVLTPALPIEQTSDHELDQLLAVNIRGTFTAMKHAHRHLKATGGCVLNISSLAGITGQARHAAYAATKGALNALTKSAAVDWGPDRIRVNALCPLGVWTDALRTWCDQQPNRADIEQHLDRIHALGYCPEPAEIATAAAFLCSDDAKFITGAIIPIAGGGDCGYRL